MIKILFTLTAFLAFNSLGQINVGPSTAIGRKVEKFDAENLRSLQNTKSIFVYREQDNLEILKALLDDAWNYTEIEFVSFKEFSLANYGEGHSFFTIDAQHFFKYSDTGPSTEFMYVYLNLWMMKDGEKTYFARIDLYITMETLKNVRELILKDQTAMMEHMYGSIPMHNWNPVYLMNALQTVNKDLEKNQERWLYESSHQPAVNQLKTDTLYIPDYTLLKFNLWTASYDKRHEVRKLLKKYPYPFKVVSEKQLLDAAVNSEKGILYLSYIHSSTNKHVSVVNSKTGDILYTEFSHTSYNIDHKDLKALAKIVKKTKNKK